MRDNHHHSVGAGRSAVHVLVDSRAVSQGNPANSVRVVAARAAVLVAGL